MFNIRVHNLKRSGLLSQVNPRIGMSVIPVLVFWITRQLTIAEIAIAAGFTASVIVFIINRRRGIIGVLAITSMLIVGAGALVGIITGNEKAFLANDAIGDFTVTTITLGSIIIRRPLFGFLARELVPALKNILEPRHSVFYITTLLLALMNLSQGVTRAYMLQNLTVDEYLIWSRVASYSLNIVMAIMAYNLIGRAARKSGRMQQAREEEGEPTPESPNLPQ